jgi:hypothetical protein
MIKKYEFVDRLIYLIRDALEKNLPQEATLDEMHEEAKELIKKIFN